MANVNKILTRGVKSGLVRDLDEERWDMAHRQAWEELVEELGDKRTPSDREVNQRACKILGLK